MTYVKHKNRYSQTKCMYIMQNACRVKKENFYYDFGKGHFGDLTGKKPPQT